VTLLSDRMLDRDKRAIRPLAGLRGLQSHLILRGTRTRVGIILEWESLALRFTTYGAAGGYASARSIPILLWKSLDDMIQQRCSRPSTTKLRENLSRSKGVRKVFPKWGISTMHRYSRAQILKRSD